MFELLFNIFLILILIGLIYLLSMLWPPDSPWAPWWKIDKKTSKIICKLAGITEKDLVYDLGCGDSTFIITASRDFKCNAIGIEIDPFRYFFSKFKIFQYRLGNKVTVKRKNFFDEKISSATIVLVYLVPKTLNKLKPKFLKELKKGTKIVSFRYQMDLKKIREDKKNKIFIYQV